MKFIFIFFLIIFTLIIFTEEYYVVNIREYISNYSNFYYPYIDIFVKSVYDSSASISFYSNLYKFQPMNFYIALDSLIFQNNIKNKFIFGDNSYIFPDMVNIRGVFYENTYKNITNGIITGKNRDFSFQDFPTFQHNKYVSMVYSKFTAFNSDTTGLYIAARNDDDYYNDYVIKQYFGIFHNSTIGRILHSSISFNRNASYTLNNQQINTNKFNYNSNVIWNFMAFNIRGEYIPQNYIGLNNILYSRGRFFNIISSSFKITDELSLYTLYQYVKYIPSNSLSYDRICGKVNMRIPTLPRISVSVDYSKYIIDNSGKKDFYWGIDAYKSIKSFLLSFTYSYLNSEYINRNYCIGTIAYTFPNYTRMGLSVNYTNIDSILNYRYTNYIRWSPVNFWNIEFGNEFGKRNNEKYFSEHLFNSINWDKVSLNMNLIMRFFEDRTYINFSTNISFTNGLSDFHLSNLTGKVFYDKNKNGIYDKGEPPVANIYVSLNDTLKVKTNKNGDYSFKFLPSGKYSVDLDKGKLPAYFDINKSFNVTLSNLKTVMLNIPLYKSGNISGYIFNDKNKNGIMDKGEEGIPNVIVKIKDSRNYTYSNRSGYYTIANLKPGNYIIEIPQLPNGYILSIPNLINYVTIDKIRQDYNVDFGIIKESKPVRKKIF